MRERGRTVRTEMGGREGWEGGEGEMEAFSGVMMRCFLRQVPAMSLLPP